MTGGLLALLTGSAFYMALFFYRCSFGWHDTTGRLTGRSHPGEGICQTTGNQEVQADRADIWTSPAGTMAVVADGIGSANTGAVCAQIAADTILDQFEPYRELNNPAYFFKTAFFEANRRIQETIGERRGGASVGVVFLNRTHLHYAVAGDVRIALLRGEELIPLSKGQTLDVLAAQAYEEGKISRQDAVWSMEEKRIWNYLGQDGFHEIEICKNPIRLKAGDKVLLISKGVFEELSWREMEDILVDNLPAQELAGRLIWEAEQKDDPEKDNGSVILIQRTEA